MEKIVVLCVVSLVGAIAVSAPSQCVVGQWSEWEECKLSHRCTSDEKQRTLTKSYDVPTTSAWDTGRSAMHLVMMMKKARLAERTACIAAGECPDTLDDRPSSGPVQCIDGLAGDIPCRNVDQLSFLNFADMGYKAISSDTIVEGNDVWGWHDPLNNDEYAIMGLTGGTTFVRITDPTKPVPVGVLYSQSVAAPWRDIKVIGNHAYIVSEAYEHGLQVFDLTRLRGGSFDTVYQPDAVHSGFGNAHNIVSNEDSNFVYVVGATDSGDSQICGGGLYAIDVSDPLNPKYAGCFGDDGYVHDAQCVIYHGADIRYSGREICFCFNEDTLTVVDVTDKASMVLVSKTGYALAGYTHQGWITEDHNTALLDDELDEFRKPLEEMQYTKTYVWDITDLRQPSLKSVHESSEKSIDHNQYILGNLTFQANYESGLRILHIERETYQLSQVAYFDVFPSQTRPEFDGSWSVYPYFKSGTVVISSINYGLFIVRPDYAAINHQVAARWTSAERKRSRGVIHRVGVSSCPALQQSELCFTDISC